jgi:nucleoside-diphosphate-sugar epimerase
VSAAQKYLVTGAYGCIGAWAVRLLLDEGCGVTFTTSVVITGCCSMMRSCRAHRAG